MLFSKDFFRATRSDVWRLLTAAMLAFAAVCGPGLPGKAQAAAGSPVETEAAAVRLIAAVDAAGDAAEVPMGLEFRLRPGWKIYWRTPGDAGLPPRLDWGASANVAGVTIAWPLPERFSLLGLETLAYGGHVVLPLAVTPAVPGEPLTLTATLEYLACSDICVPYDAELSLSLPAGPASPSAEAHVIDRFTGAVPVPAAQAGVSFTEARYTPLDGGGVGLRVTAVSASTLFSAAAPPDLIVEGPEGSFFHTPQVQLRDGGARALFTLEGGLPKGEAAQLPLTLTLYDAARAVEGRLQALPEAAGISSSTDAGGLFWILLLALLGGLVLNLMPCVLPVLSLKLLGAVRNSSGAAGAARAGFAASAAGILTAFLLLAAALAGLKTAGISIGWGVQFQQPLFLAFMILVMTLFAASLAGLLSFRLPQSVADAALGAIHKAEGGRHRLTGDFTAGLFATLLATPCSAPFVGTAVAFALERGTAEIFMVFTAMGFGLASPWLLAVLFPRLPARLLPAPGPWMGVMQRLLALALAATVLWLLTVLAVSLGWQGAVATGFLAVLLPVLLAARRRWPGPLTRRLAPVLCLFAAAGILGLPFAAPQGESRLAGAGTPDGGAIGWVRFDPAAIPAAVAEGRTVFVDITASWCLTCQVNKAMVLNRGPVTNWLRGPDVVAMEGDWTMPDPVIAAYLASFGRYGIPFNVIYGPGAPSGILLPELLTDHAVLEAARRAAGTDAPS